MKLSREAVDLAEHFRTIRTVIELRAVEMGITTDFEGTDEAFTERYVYTSPLHFRQLLMNIFSNSLKYNKPEGRVSAKVSCLGEEDGRITYRFVIADTGIGMSKEFLEHMFEPFSQEHADARSVYTGTGLGMSIVKGLVDTMGGTIGVDSTVGEGTTFTIDLPFDIASESELVREEENNEIDLSGRKILLAEDNELNAEIATEVLEDAGANVTWAKNGKEALDFVSSKPAGFFDVVLMDLMMPVMNGYDATRAIRRLEDSGKAFAPIVAMTANAYDEDKQNALSCGMNGFVPKPVFIPFLMKELSRILH